MTDKSPRHFGMKVLNDKALFPPEPQPIEYWRAIQPVDPNVQPPDVPRLTGQNATVLEWLQSGERVTPRTAFERGVTRLAARIHDLKSAGYRVRSDIDSSRCAVYWMEVGK